MPNTREVVEIAHKDVELLISFMDMFFSSIAQLDCLCYEYAMVAWESFCYCLVVMFTIDFKVGYVTCHILVKGCE